MIPEGVVLVAGPYLANGVSNTFDFEFQCSSDEHVEVTVSVDDVETILVLDTDFTVALNPDQDSNPGGVVTIVTVPEAGTLVVVASDVPAQQGLDLTQGGAFNPEVIEQKFDDIVLMIGRLRADNDRAVKSGITSGVDPDAIVASLLAAVSAAQASAAIAVSAAAAAEAAVPSGSLAYTPVDIAGDSMTGQLEVPSLVVNGGAVLSALTSAAVALLDDTTFPAMRTTLDASRLTASRSAVTPATDDYIGGTDTSDSGSEKRFLVSELVALASVAPTTGVIISVDFAASGSGTFTKPTDATKALVEVVGGGGVGRGDSGGASYGGGAGGYSAKLYTAANVTYTVGAGATSERTNGGTTTATVSAVSITASGGNGTSSGAGGTASGGDINVTGQAGESANANASERRVGGSGMLLNYGSGALTRPTGGSTDIAMAARSGAVRVTWYK